MSKISADSIKAIIPVKLTEHSAITNELFCTVNSPVKKETKSKLVKKKYSLYYALIFK
ncbi:hypothetical protein ACQKJC_08045 [Priestia koreensis]|uniref:hypothetical protein n=1 Tax=Priestia koreensis TaxID=284581 RepID=UPI003D00E1E3